MKLLKSILIASALLCIVPLAAEAAESVVDLGFFALILPEGYTHAPKRGIDSQVGDILIKDKPFIIHYDSYGWGEGPKRFSELPKEMLDSVVYYELLQNDPFVIGIFAWLHPSAPKDPIVTLEIFGLGAGISIGNASKAQLLEAVAALRAIKVSKLPRTPK